MSSSRRKTQSLLIEKADTVANKENKNTSIPRNICMKCSNIEAREPKIFQKKNRSCIKE